MCPAPPQIRAQAPQETLPPHLHRPPRTGTQYRSSQHQPPYLRKRAATADLHGNAAASPPCLLPLLPEQRAGRCCPRERILVRRIHLLPHPLRYPAQPILYRYLWPPPLLAEFPLPAEALPRSLGKTKRKMRTCPPSAGQILLAAVGPPPCS